jgi:hypothetical protein
MRPAASLLLICVLTWLRESTASLLLLLLVPLLGRPLLL